MPHIRVNPEIKAKTAVCERSQTYRLDGHASRDAQLRVLEPSADPLCRPGLEPVLGLADGV
jgi:hypothetical protein